MPTGIVWKVFKAHPRSWSVSASQRYPRVSWRAFPHTSTSPSHVLPSHHGDSCWSAMLPTTPVAGICRNLAPDEATVIEIRIAGRVDEVGY